MINTNCLYYLLFFRIEIMANEWVWLVPSVVIIIFLMVQMVRGRNYQNCYREGPKQYVFYPRDILTKQNWFPDFLFRQTFRMTRKTFQELLEVTGQFIPVGRSPNNQSLQPPERLLLFLKFIGSNQRYAETWVSFS